MKKQHCNQTWGLFFIILFSSNLFALPFNIVPKTGISLPTVVVAGQTVAALYTVANNSATTRYNNYVAYLPNGVTQVTQNAGIPDLCGSTFNLTPKGTTGDSCTLQLNITQAVNANDPNPHQHLFVCLPGGKSCAGTYYPLNVSMISGNTQWAASGVFNNNQAVAAISNDQGQSWQFQTLDYPPGVNTSTLNGSSCTTQQCVLAGQYATESVLPGIATINTSSRTWNQQVLPPVSEGGQGLAYGVSCYATTCLAVGIYVTNNVYPYVAQSQDQGISWTQQLLMGISSETYSLNSLSGVNCSGSNCVAVGTV